MKDNSIDSTKFFEELGRTELLGPEYPLPPEFYTWKELRKQSNYKDFLKLLISDFSYYNRSQEKFLCFIQQDWKDIYPTRLEIDVIRKLANNKKEEYLASDAADVLEGLGYL